MKSEETEILLVKALKKGSTSAFDKLFSIYASRIYHFTYGYLKSKEDAEEVVQEVFLRIWSNRIELKPELSFKAYLFKIAFNQILENFDRVRRKQTFKDKLLEESIKFTPKFDERLDYQNLLEKVEEIINHLPERQKAVILKRRRDGQHIKEIAQELGISPKTVENHLTEALKNIRKQLGEDNFSSLLFFVLFVNS